jgi:transcription antitermination factor NusG
VREWACTCCALPRRSGWGIRAGSESLGGVCVLGRQRHRFWTVLKTKQSSSSDARANVANQDFEFFHPTFRMRAVRGVRRVAPLFPFYLMVRVDERRQDWRALCSTRGVSCVLLSGDGPGQVPDAVVSDFRAIVDDTDDGYYHDPQHDSPRFSPGAAVEGTRGLFEGKYGTYRGLAGNRGDRVRVLFDILGREAEFEVGVDDLVAVAA